MKAGTKAVLPSQLVEQRLKVTSQFLSYEDYEKELSNEIFIWGAGKAATEFARALRARLVEECSHKTVSGIILEIGHESRVEEGIEYIGVRPPGFNWPTEESCKATKKLINELQRNRHSSRIGFITGGASAMLTSPVVEVDLETKIAICQKVSRSGGDIKDLNTIRILLSQVKGGSLSQHLNDDDWVFILSDVVGDDLSFIASGPTYPPRITQEQYQAVVQRYKLTEDLPVDVWRKLIHRRSQSQDDKQISNFILGSNSLAMKAVANAAADSDFKVNIDRKAIERSTSEFVRHLRDILDKPSPKSCFLYGGELTLQLEHDKLGQGGRCQHAALELLSTYIGQDWPNASIVFLATDGEDGTGGASGCMITPANAKEFLKYPDMIRKHLEHYDSYGFFENTTAQIVTGPTGTNVMDLYGLFFH